MGVLEAVELQIDKFVFLINFIVIKMDDSLKASLIFRIGQEKAIFHITQPTSSSNIEKVLHIDAIDEKLAYKGDLNKGQQVHTFFYSFF